MVVPIGQFRVVRFAQIAADLGQVFERRNIRIASSNAIWNTRKSRKSRIVPVPAIFVFSFLQRSHSPTLSRFHALTLYGSATGGAVRARRASGVNQAGGLPPAWVSSADARASPSDQ